MNLAFLALHSSPVSRLGSRDAGGMSVVLVNLAAALARRGHRVDLFTCRGDAAPGSPVELHPGVRLFRLDAGGAGSAPKDRLHLHLDAAVQELSCLAGDKGLAYDLVHSHYWVSAVAGQAISSTWRVPHLVTFHTLGFLKNRLGCGEDEPPRRLAAESGLAAGCDRVVSPSAGERDALTCGLGLTPERVAVVPWGVDRERFRPGGGTAPRRGFGPTPDQDLLLFVGRFAPVKGLDLLLRALQEVAAYSPEVRLLVAGGDGSEDADTLAGRALAADLGISDRVQWLGPTSQATLAVWYRAVDLVVVPSRYESFGLVALEALASGTPVVATRVGAMQQVVVPGANGYLASEPEPSSLASAIRRQLTGPPPEPAEVCRTVESWTWERSAGMLAQVYAAALDAPP